MTTTTDIEHPDCISHLLPGEILEDMSNDFARISGTGFGFLDKDGIKITLVNFDQDFCDAICNDDAELIGHCRKTREKLAVLHHNTIESMKLRQNDITHHTCFLGFDYSVRSVIMEGDVIGYCVLGPCLTPDYQVPSSEIIEKAVNVTSDQIKAFYSNLKHTSHKEAGSILLSACGIIDTINDYAYKVFVAGQMQYASMEENYRILLERNKELQETKIRLEELDKLKSNLLSTISHELRTPLTSIIGYSDMLLGQTGGKLSKDQHKFINTINEKGGALLDMINKILDVASIEAGRFEISKGKYPIEELIESMIDKIRSESSRQDVKIDYAKAEEKFTTYGDPITIEKALYHVIDNAVKFSPPGGSVQVQIRKVTPEMEKKDHRGFVIMAPMMKSVEIMVRDFGPGIPEALKNKIFEPFYQAEDPATRSHGGLGLGLAIVKQYIWANNGTISVDSQEGMGSTFIIRLPVQE